MTAGIISKGLDEFAEFFRELPEIATEAAYFAVNDSAESAVPMFKRTMGSQIAFPKGYLSKERLGVRRKATRATLEAVISGRDRPTSLARFAEGATPENSRKRPVIVKVKPGKTVSLKKSFLVRLRNNNIGLAIRLPAGQRPKNAYKPVQLAENVYLLYGPSVDQVLQGVIEESDVQIGDMISRNFLRQFTRLSRG